MRLVSHMQLAVDDLIPPTLDLRQCLDDIGCPARDTGDGRHGCLLDARP
jgi:hypothetical protein